ncbi:hypothetical protein DQ02_04365 [Citrobacter amalonaticus]|nr:hypothetical protein DQ02_04365 [Citrobacter amalonaticus]
MVQVQSPNICRSDWMTGHCVQVIDSILKVQMDCITLKYSGCYHVVKWMERLAQGIADGVIEAQKEH